MMEGLHEYNPQFVIHPGEYVEELLETEGMTQTELATRIGFHTKTINTIIKGKAAISPKMAMSLERVFDRPAEYWLNLQAHYDIWAERNASTSDKSEMEKFLSMFDYSALAKQFSLPATRKMSEKFEALLSYFSVSSAKSWESIWLNPSSSFRIVNSGKSKKIGNVAAWIRWGQLYCEKTPLKPYSKTAFEKSLHSIREMTVSMSDFQSRIIDECNQAGVYILFIPEPPHTGICGATYWVNNRKNPVIQMSIRFKTNDHFWFSLYHEAGHILFDKKTKDVNIDWIGDDDKDKENVADKFAQDFLIDSASYLEFLAKGTYCSGNAIRQFAEEINIHPGIIVGRLQHDGKIPYNYFHDLKMKLEWAGQE